VFSKLTLNQVVLDWEKISKTLLEKGIFYFVLFFSDLGFCGQNFEKWPSQR
jgi:hypothetical protein